MEIRLKTGHQLNDISIICSYAPYMGYGEIERNKYRNGLNNHMDPIPNNYIKIWMTDNNGQISQEENTKDIIGKWNIGNKTEVGNGENI